MKVKYKAPGNWTGIAWQNPANDWGDLPGGYDLTGAKKLTFWARGEFGIEILHVIPVVLPQAFLFFHRSASTFEKISVRNHSLR